MMCQSGLSIADEMLNPTSKMKLEAQVGQKSLTWIRLIMICYIVPWWQSWLSDQIAFSNPESDVV